MAATGTAFEQRSLDEVLENMPRKRMRAQLVFSRLRGITALPDAPRVLDIGAASGGMVAAWNELGCRCEGVEPWDEARARSDDLSRHLGVPIHIVEGAAESIPHEANTFDIVIAASVIEHVADLDDAFSEIYRVLKPGGVFWFSTASSRCPKQAEILGFPLFSWYPDPLKVRIMNWVKDARPHLVNYTQTPAIHWFTPKKARRVLGKHGFERIHDRWDLRREEEGGPRYRTGLRLIRRNGITKFIGDVAFPDCAFAAFKPQQ